MILIKERNWHAWSYRHVENDSYRRIRKQGLDAYITMIPGIEVQLLFNKLIVDRNWRHRMWDIPKNEM
jgi:hypothetical protein